MTALWLDPIPEALRELASAALRGGDWLGFLVKAQNDYSLALVYRNGPVLREQGLYEEALLHALTICRLNNARWPLEMLRRICEGADRDRLRAAGDPLPGPSPFTLYRGVTGRTSARRVRGISWTASLQQAWWLADRSALFGLADPGVYRATVPESRVVAYSNRRQEEEFIVLLDPHDRVDRIGRRSPSNGPAPDGVRCAAARRIARVT